MNSLYISKVEIIEAGQQLSSKWTTVKEVWNDAARQDFEQSHWTEFETIVAASAKKLEDLIDTIAQAEREMP